MLVGSAHGAGGDGRHGRRSTMQQRCCLLLLWGEDGETVDGVHVALTMAHHDRPFNIQIENHSFCTDSYKEYLFNFKISYSILKSALYIYAGFRMSILILFSRRKLRALRPSHHSCAARSQIHRRLSKTKKDVDHDDCDVRRTNNEELLHRNHRPKFTKREFTTRMDRMLHRHQHRL